MGLTPLCRRNLQQRLTSIQSKKLRKKVNKVIVARRIPCTQLRHLHATMTSNVSTNSVRRMIKLILLELQEMLMKSNRQLTWTQIKVPRSILILTTSWLSPQEVTTGGSHLTVFREENRRILLPSDKKLRALVNRDMALTGTNLTHYTSEVWLLHPRTSRKNQLP
jgi:hypothetical protein